MKQRTRHALHQSLQRMAFVPAYTGLELLPDTGLAHWHVRLLGSGLLARVPKQSQMGWAPDINLAYQSACFRAAGLSHCVPQFYGVCPVSTDLPYGALLVQEIVGSGARLPVDLTAIATTLARIHSVPLDAIAQSDLNLLKKDGSLTGILAEVCQHRDQIDQALLPASFYKTLREGIEELSQYCETSAQFTSRLIAYDVHPGNFLMQTNGTAILVDLEKVRVSAAGFDLAHATQYTSTTWDIKNRAELSVQQILDFYSTWQAKVKFMGNDPRQFLITRKAMWLWAISWCASWLSTTHKQAIHQDCNAIKANNEEQLFLHVKERCEHYVSPIGLDRVQSELAQLAVYWR